MTYRKNMMQGKRAAAAAVASALVVCMLTACRPGGGAVSETNSAPEAAGHAENAVQADLEDDSLLNFHNDSGFARLRSDMESGDIPVECNVLYDEMGTRPDVTVKDPAIIRDLYGRLCDVTVGDKSTESVTDSYHHITFRLRNDSYVSCYFEGENLFCWGKDNYSVSGTGSLWSYVRQLQETAMRESGQTLAAGDDSGSGQNGPGTGQSGRGNTADRQGTEKEKTETPGAGQTAQYALTGGASADLEDAEVSGSDGNTSGTQEDTRLSGGNPTGGQQTHTGSDSIQISGGDPLGEEESSDGQKTADPKPAIAKAGTQDLSGDGGETGTQDAAGDGTGTDTQDDSAQTAVTKEEIEEPPVPQDGTAEAGTAEVQDGSTGSDGSTDAASQGESAGPEETAAEGESGQTQAETQAQGSTAETRTEPAAKGIPDAAYTEIVRAYAAVKAQDPEKFIEDYASGLYSADGGQAAGSNAGQTSATGRSGDTAAAAPAADPRINYEMFRTYFGHPEGNSIYYGLRDYNEDGIRELVILMGSAESPAVWAVYTYDGAKAVPLFTGKYALAERNTLYVLPGGRFLIHGSGGASAGVDVICRIAEGARGLEVIAEYSYDEQANGNMDHSSGQETLTNEAFQEKYYSQQSSAAEDISRDTAEQDSTVITAPVQQSAAAAPVIYEEYIEHKEHHEMDETVEVKKY